MTSEDEEICRNSHICWICKVKDKVKIKMDQVKDHCHVTGKFREVLHIINVT